MNEGKRAPADREGSMLVVAVGERGYRVWKRSESIPRELRGLKTRRVEDVGAGKMD